MDLLGPPVMMLAKYPNVVSRRAESMEIPMVIELQSLLLVCVHLYVL